jgi:meso-butanediol dehydrogenase/(S,S)-butanediol dehydrogenase/diacetyl reductase
LEGKIAFISGTGRHGTGQAAARVFAAEGAKVFGCALHKETSEVTVGLVRDAGGVMDAMAPINVSTAEGAEAWIAAGESSPSGASTSYSTMPQACATERLTRSAR